MKANTVKLLLLVAGTVFYNFCFWCETAGLNVLIFTVVMLPVIFIFNPLAAFNNGARVAAAGCLLFAGMTVIFNSDASIIGVIVSFLLLNGFALLPTSRFFPVAFAGGVINFFMGPFSQLYNASFSFRLRKRVGSSWVLVVMPLLVVLVFFLIFYAANPDFGKFTDHVITRITDTIVKFFEQFSFLHLFFLSLGAFIIAGFLFKKAMNSLHDWENNFKSVLHYNEAESKPLSFIGLQQLNDESKAGIMMLVLVNLLALVVNIIDIKTQWIGFKFHEGMNLSQQVHEGTGLLIFSILLAMAILLYLFRGNQNFTDATRRLKVLAYIWVLQNAILCISVAIRNYHYIENYGLAYKRIGVVFFLMLTVFGLITISFKILRNKPITYLFRLNSWAVYAVLLLIACCNWDLLIARYNLNYAHRYEFPVEGNSSSARESSFNDHIDRQFLLTLSDKSLQAFLDHPEFFPNNVKGDYTKSEYGKRVKDFLNRKKQEGFMSWNYAESRTWKALNEKYHANP